MALCCDLFVVILIVVTALCVWPLQFSVFLGLIFFLELTAGILAFVFKDWIKDQLNLFINNNVKAYRDDIDLQNLIDFAQEYVSGPGSFPTPLLVSLELNLSPSSHFSPSSLSPPHCYCPSLCVSYLLALTIVGFLF